VLWIACLQIDGDEDFAGLEADAWNPDFHSSFPTGRNNAVTHDRGASSTWLGAHDMKRRIAIIAQHERVLQICACFPLTELPCEPI
jgi:hypothetical protein